MALIVLSLVLYIFGLVLGGRYLLGSQAGKYWGVNFLVIALNVGLFFMQGVIKDTHTAVYVGMMQLVFFASYILLTAVIAMVIGIRKGSAAMFAWAASVMLIIVLIAIVALGQ